MRILNLYAGLGGNRKLWTDVEVTAVELEPRVAAVYERLYPADTVVRGDAYTNTAEGYFSILKRGLYGTYQAVSDTHLHRYLAEFDFRYSKREKLGYSDEARAYVALCGVKGKRLTYAAASQS
jgi:hypothetical protein